MGILSWILMGLIVGVVAKLLMPGRDPGGFIITILLGIAGAIVGGFIASLFGLGSAAAFTFHTFLVALGGAVLLLVLYRLVRRERV